MSQIQTSEACVLHARPHRETSVWVTLLTAEHGLLSVMGKGVRRSQTPLKGLLQPFQRIWVSWRTKSAISWLLDADFIERVEFPSPVARMAGFYVNELLYRLLPHHEVHPDFFECYTHTLKQFSTSELEPALRYFERDLLLSMGYGIECYQDYRGVLLREEEIYHYHPARGFGIEAVAGSLPISGQSIVALRDNLLKLEDYAVVKRMLRLALRMHLGDRPLQSQQLIRSWNHDKNTVGG